MCAVSFLFADDDGFFFFYFCSCFCFTLICEYVVNELKMYIVLISINIKTKTKRKKAIRINKIYYNVLVGYAYLLFMYDGCIISTGNSHLIPSYMTINSIRDSKTSSARNNETQKRNKYKHIYKWNSNNKIQQQINSRVNSLSFIFFLGHGSPRFFFFLICFVCFWFQRHFSCKSVR